MLLNTSHVEICSILCIQCVLYIGYPFYEIKRICHRAYIWKFSAFDQFSKSMKDNTSPKYRAKTAVIFSSASFFLLPTAK